MRLSAVPLAAGAMVLVAAPSSPQAATGAQSARAPRARNFKRVDGRWLVDVATANTATLGCLR